MNRLKPWTVEFVNTGGYDCMTGAFVIRDANHKTVLVVDQGDFGQEPCDYGFHSKEAEAVANEIVEKLGR